MTYTKEDLANTVNRSELRGEKLVVLHAIGTQTGLEWKGGFILQRADGTIAVIEGRTGPSGWSEDRMCGYDLRVVRTLVEAFAMVGDRAIFEVDPDPAHWDPGVKELDDELDKYIGTKDPRDPRGEPKLEPAQAEPIEGGEPSAKASLSTPK